MGAYDEEAEALWQKLMNTVALDHAWTSDFTPSPHDAYAVGTRLAALGARALPLLVEHLTDPDPDAFNHALVAIAQMGAAARPAAAAIGAVLDRLPDDDSLERRRAIDALCVADFDAVVARGLDWKRSSRKHVAEWVLANRSKDEARAYFRRLLALDPETVRFVLAGTGSFAGFQGLHAMPELAERAVIEPLLSSPDAAVRAAAGRTLLALGGGDRSDEIIRAHLGRSPVSLHLVEELAPLRASDRLVPDMIAGRRLPQLIVLAKRRRQAGRPIESAEIDAWLESILARDPKTEDENREYEAALELATELANARRFAQRVAEAEARPIGTFKGPFVGWGFTRYRKLSAGKDLRAMRDRADACFLKGDIDLGWPYESAESGYDEVLLADPRDAHAAFQLAWIARAFGAPMDSARVDFIRGLGFRDESLLAELAEPLESALRGSRADWKPASTGSPSYSASHAYDAERAGLPSLAARELGTLAKYYTLPGISADEKAEAPERIPKLRAEQEALEDLALAHIARVREAT